MSTGDWKKILMKIRTKILTNEKSYNKKLKDKKLVHVSFSNSIFVGIVVRIFARIFFLIESGPRFCAGPNIAGSGNLITRGKCHMFRLRSK